MCAFQVPRVPKPTASLTPEAASLVSSWRTGHEQTQGPFQGICFHMKTRSSAPHSQSPPCAHKWGGKQTRTHHRANTPVPLPPARLTLQAHGDPAAPSHATGGPRELIKADSVRASWQILLKRPPPSPDPDYYRHLYGRIKINFLSYNKNDKNESLGSK